jgi:hypothetical protein
MILNIGEILLEVKTAGGVTNLMKSKMKDGAFDSAELVVRRTLRSFDQKKSFAYPGRFSVRVAIWGSSSAAPQRHG